MKLTAKEYQVFYEQLREVFYNDKASHVAKESIFYSPELWETGTIGPDGKEVGPPVAINLFQLGTSAKRLWRTYRDTFKILFPVKDETVFSALKYMGIKPVMDKKEWQRLPESDKAKHLFEEFRKKYIPADGEIPAGDKQQVYRTAEQGNHSLQEASAAVTQFYELIAINKLKEAWDLLSVKFQNREVWQGDYKRFEGGYVTTRGLRDIAVFNARHRPPYIDCKVFYEDEMSIYPVKGLNGFEDMTVAETEEFIRRLQIVRQDIESKGGADFDKVPLNKFFNPAAIEYIWYECGLDADRLHLLFPKPKPVIVWRIYDATCIFEHGKWLINDISPAKTYSIR